MTKNKLLFTPGPLTTSDTVKAAMLRDAGSRDRDFLNVVRTIREKLLAIGGAPPGGDYECVLMQGSGTFAIESVISSAIPRDGRLLVLVNGAYGRRIVQMARIHGIEVATLEVAENCKLAPAVVAGRLALAPRATHVAVVHCETTTGIVNPVEEIGEVAASAGATYIVDAMSSFGAIPIGRAARYLRNYQALAAGMAAMGFEPYLAPEDRGYIITTYRCPDDPAFHFADFYTRLSELGFVIYPGKLSQEPCFRIGTIGRLDTVDIERLLGAIHAVIQGMASQATASLRDF